MKHLARSRSAGGDPRRRRVLDATCALAIALLGAVGVRADWTPEERISDDLAFSTTTPANQSAVAVDSAGNVHIVWLDDRPGNREVFYRRFESAAGRWGAECRITWPLLTGWDQDGGAIYEEYEHGAPGIVVDSVGNLAVSVENRTTGRAGVMLHDPEDGECSWGTVPTELGEGGLSDTNPVLAVDADDQLHAVWLGLVAGETQVFYRRYAPGIGWQPAEQVTSASSGKQTPAIAAAASGSLHVVWADDRDHAGGGAVQHEIYHLTRSGAGVWGTPTRLSEALDSDSLVPAVAVDGAGGVHVAWEDDRDGDFAIYYRADEDGSGDWGAERRITDAVGASGGVHVAVDSWQRVHLVWEDRRHAGVWGWTHTSLYYTWKDAAWHRATRLARQGHAGSLVAAGADLHVGLTADRPLTGNPEVFYLRFDPTLTSPPAHRDLVLLLDTSRSMSWKEDGTPAADPSESRLYKAGQALSNFLDRFSLRNPSDVRFGLVTFPHSSIRCPSAETVIPAAGPLPPLDESAREAVIRSVIPGLTADGATPMVEGLTQADALLPETPGDAMILLVSDGYHNCPDRSTPEEWETFLSSFTTSIHTIGIGTALEVDLDLLANIAAATGGEFLDATLADPLDLIGWLKTLLVSILELEAESDPKGTIAGGERESHSAWITDHDSEIAFDVSWSRPGDGRIGFTLRTPRGDAITPEKAHSSPGITHVSRDTYQLYYLAEEFLQEIDRAGRWSLELSAEHLDQGVEEEYRYGVLLNTDLELVPELASSYRTGEPITIRATVQENGRRLPTRLRAVVSSPSADLGSWLARSSPDPQAVLAMKRSRLADPPPRHALKALALAGEQGTAPPTSLTSSALPLFDDGTHGDRVPHDLVYTNVLTDTWVPGTYVFDITAKGSSSAGQPYRRQAVLQRVVEASVAKERTVLRAERRPPDSSGAPVIRVTIMPRDRQGNDLGPGRVRRLWLAVLGGRARTALEDNLDGSYSQEFGLDAAAARPCLPVTVGAADRSFQSCVPLSPP